jgi:phage gp45-like
MFALDQITHMTPEAVYTGNLHINGNLIVDGYIHAKGDIVAGTGGRNVSLLDHTHDVESVESGTLTKKSDKPN